MPDHFHLIYTDERLPGESHSDHIFDDPVRVGLSPYPMQEDFHMTSMKEKCLARFSRP